MDSNGRNGKGSGIFIPVLLHQPEVLGQDLRDLPCDAQEERRPGWRYLISMMSFSKLGWRISELTRLVANESEWKPGQPCFDSSVSKRKVA